VTPERAADPAAFKSRLASFQSIEAAAPPPQPRRASLTVSKAQTRIQKKITKK